MSPIDVRREQRATRRRILAALTQRRLERQARTGVLLENASISRTGRIPTDS